MEENPNLQENPNKPGPFIKRRAFRILVVTFVLFKLITLIIVPNRGLSIASNLTIDNILQAVNKERSLKNLTILTTNSKLTLAAQSKADDMQARHYFAHVDPDGHYIWDKIVAAGYSPYLELGENLAIEFYDTDSLMSAWMNSPTHRANVLQEGFRDQGMGLNLGDVASGQYHSAIANTFGAQAVSTKPVAVVPKPKPPAAEPAKTTPPVVTNTKPDTTPPPTPAKPPEQQPVPVTETPVVENTSTATNIPVPPQQKQPIQIRGEDSLAVKNQGNFALPSKSEDASSTQQGQTSSTPEISNFQPLVALIGSPDSNTLNDYQTNRYLILVSGACLLLLMLSDIRITIEKRFKHLDKKINNLMLLLISLIVIAFLYWM